jgi:hypothetical protein
VRNLLKQFPGGVIHIWRKVVRAIQNRSGSRGNGRVSKSAAKCSLTNWSLFGQVISLPVDLFENCVLHSLLGVEVQHPPSAVLHLHHPHTLAMDVLPEGIVKPTPEGSVLFAFHNCKDFAFSSVILLVLRRFKTIRQMLLSMALPMLSKVVAPLFTYRQTQFDIVDGELEQCIDLTPSCSVAEIAVVPQLPVMPPQKGPVNLTLTDP